MTKSQYCCNYCNKAYVIKSAYNNHLLKCKFAKFSSARAWGHIPANGEKKRTFFFSDIFESTRLILISAFI